ncbi:hypothetical protein AOXY_G32205 [Acipenser oxyrinchus oxyrinchus]|uniref:Ig-like domain-containing protein n=1 Tax=Acipenser oxyrinchus oxyrinchus TaxID=40147 RepID=A0AAD8CJH7_ACIOX|nr:hypothetical protein AOXY_G32205 [Acipenser oxyrinchus oxyrinchus]
MGLISFGFLVLLLLGDSVSSDDDEEEFTVTDWTITLCPNKKISSLSRWLSQRSDVRVSLWLLSYTELERNVWCSEDPYAECSGVSSLITLEGGSTPKKGKYKCVVRKNKTINFTQGFTLTALRGATSHSNPAPEGSSLSLTCEGWGLPEVQKWEWTRNSVVISGTSKYMNNANLNTLTIRRLEKSDGGTYTCKPVLQQIGLTYSVSIEYTVSIAGLTIASTNTPEKTTTGLTIASITEESTAGLTIASTNTPEKTTTDQGVVLLVTGAALVLAAVAVAVAVIVCITKKNREQTQGTPDPAPQHAGASRDYENLPPRAPEQQGPDNTEPTYMGLNLAEQSVYSTLQSVEISKPGN